LSNLKSALPELEKLLDECSDHWGYEDPLYRFYHQSFKVYALGQTTTGSIRVDGWQGTSKLGGGSGGGNAGGTIILEAPAVTVDGYLSALGGEGGNEFDAPPGSDGVYTGGNGVDPDPGGGGGAGLILIYGDARTLFEPRITSAASTVCTQFLPLLH